MAESNMTRNGQSISCDAWNQFSTIAKSCGWNLGQEFEPASRRK